MQNFLINRFLLFIKCQKVYKVGYHIFLRVCILIGLDSFIILGILD